LSKSITNHNRALPMPSSHSRAEKPTPLLGLIALCIVHRTSPQWLRTGPSEAAKASGISPERLSRLTSRALAPFETAVVTLCRRGRPPRARANDETRSELLLCRALLDVAQALLRHVPMRSATVREAVVAAWRRLHQDE